ncbi:GNAT family N-acetyltransferase [Burkholderiaceae bacterium DAT-1]|nr:GNAT family N-acetyltransferase [Burkholderiaceae bacterium DAT-1]
MPDIVIERARADDAAAIEALYRVLGPSSPPQVSPERIARLHDHPEQSVLVMRVDGVVRATALLMFGLDVMFGEQDIALVENVVVDPACQNQGLGTMLMKEIDRLALARGVSKLMLLSGNQREQAHSFYVERCGYQASKQGFVKYRRMLLETAAEPHP